VWGVGRLDVQNADQALAEAWDNSAAAREELGEQPGMIRRAIGLGRSLLDPLPVLAALCGAPPSPAYRFCASCMLAHGMPDLSEPWWTRCLCSWRTAVRCVVGVAGPTHCKMSPSCSMRLQPAVACSEQTLCPFIAHQRRLHGTRMRTAESAQCLQWIANRNLLTSVC